MSYITDSYALSGETLVKQFKKRNMEAFYCATKEEAKEKILSMIPNGSSVTWGGTESMEEAGVCEAIRQGDYEFIDRKKAKAPEESRALYGQIVCADYFLTSSNAFTKDGIIDLLTIIPAFFLSGFVIFRMLRVARIFHLFRLNAKYDSFNVITTVLYEKRNQIISSVFIVLILMLASSLCMYSVEHEAQPAVFRNAFSGIWWSMSTLLTVGYGDIYPITALGRIMAICIAYLGVGAVAIPTGIISAGFVEQYQRKSSISDLKDADIQEIAEVFVDKRYAGKTVEEMEEAQQITIFLVLRDDFSVLSQKNTVLKLNDIIIIRVEGE